MRIVFAMAVLAIALPAFPALADTPQASPVYREGVHYYELSEAVPVEDPDKIEVTEVFWYGCGHCFHFEPRVLEWAKDLPEDVNFVQLPAMWNRVMEAHARAYYTAGKLGILEKVHQPIYDALNIDRKPLDKAEAVAELFAEFGADEKEVVEIFDSTEATSYLKVADTKARAYEITGTPQLIVHGLFRIEANRRVPQSEMFDVVEFLVEKVRAAQRGGNE